MKCDSLKKVLELEKQSMVSACVFYNMWLVKLHPRVFSISESSLENKGLYN